MLVGVEVVRGEVVVLDQAGVLRETGMAGGGEDVGREPERVVVEVVVDVAVGVRPRRAAVVLLLESSRSGRRRRRCSPSSPWCGPSAGAPSARRHRRRGSRSPHPRERWTGAAHPGPSRRSADRRRCRRRGPASRRHARCARTPKRGSKGPRSLRRPRSPGKTRTVPGSTSPTARRQPGEVTGRTGQPSR